MTLLFHVCAGAVKTLYVCINATEKNESQLGKHNLMVLFVSVISPDLCLWLENKLILMQMICRRALLFVMCCDFLMGSGLPVKLPTVQ